MNHAAITHRTEPVHARNLHGFLWEVVAGRHHVRALLGYMIIAGGHFLEHLAQISQVYLFGVPAKEAGGLLGELLPGLAASEVLHMTYNSFQLTGLILLAPGFRRYRAARAWWTAAIVAQSWHWLEHAFLQYQYITGHYFYGALKQMSILERFVPRVELHMAYNLLAFTPTVIGLVLYLRHRAREARQ